MQKKTKQRQRNCTGYNHASQRHCPNSLLRCCHMVSLPPSRWFPPCKHQSLSVLGERRQLLLQMCPLQSRGLISVQWLCALASSRNRVWEQWTSRSRDKTTLVLRFACCTSTLFEMAVHVVGRLKNQDRPHLGARKRILFFVNGQHSIVLEPNPRVFVKLPLGVRDKSSRWCGSTTKVVVYSVWLCRSTLQ